MVEAVEKKSELEDEGGRRAAGYDLETMELDDLVPLQRDALDEIYRASTVPKVDDFDGPLDGRILYGIIPTFHSPYLRERVINKTWWMPWLGKVHTVESETKAMGSNRLHIGPICFDYFKYELSITPSMKENLEVLRFNYNLKGNFIARVIVDECRKVNDRMLLGRVYMVIGKWSAFIMYFAIGTPQE